MKFKLSYRKSQFLLFLSQTQTYFLAIYFFLPPHSLKIPINRNSTTVQHREKKNHFYRFLFPFYFSFLLHQGVGGGH